MYALILLSLLKCIPMHKKYPRSSFVLQKRQMYESAKVKKIGQQFYATANVKNRRNR